VTAGVAVPPERARPTPGQRETAVPAGRLGAYRLLVRWTVLRQRKLLGIFVAIQIAIGVGIIYGFTFLVPHVTAQVALYFSTGATTLTLILIGLVVVPQEVALARTSGRQAYLDSLPVPRLAPLLAEVSFWVMIQVPGAAATLALAVLRFHLSLHVSALIIPVMALTALTSAALGCAISMSLPPMATQQVAQFLSLALLLFSPINFPLARLPLILRDIHRGLPVVYMADLVRGALTGHYGTSVALAFGVVGGWCAAGLFLSARIASRRG
jgi:ABC-2 type transport system permease protein